MLTLRRAMSFCLPLILSACGGNSGQTAPDSPASGIRAGLPFPAAHGPSAVTTATLLGRQTEQRSSGATDQGDSLNLDAAASSFEYGLYRFNLGDTPTELDVTLGSGEVWVCLADFAAVHWEVLGPFSNPLDIALGNVKYVNGLGDTWVGLVVQAGASAVVDELALSADSGLNQPPTAEVAASPDGPAPLEVTFDAGGSSDPDGSIVLYEWDFTDNGSFDASDSADSIQHTYSNPGSFTCRLRVTDNDGATDEATVQVNVAVPANLPPVADIQASPSEADPPEFINFDAGGSTDQDGSIILYEWDLDGDGVFDSATGGVATNGGVYNSPGAIEVGVRVTDNDGASAVATVQVILHGWVLVTADPAPDTGMMPSLLVLNGKPAIAHYDYGNQELKFSLSSTALGANPLDWQSVTVDNTANGVGQDPSLANIGGNPAIAYSDNSVGRQKYAYSATPDGLSPTDWTLVVLNGPAINGGMHPSLAEVAGHPAVAYYDNLNGQNLLYRRASSPTGADAADWLGSVPVDFAGDTGEYPSLRVVAGNPAIAYQSEVMTTRHIKYARSSTPTGESMLDWEAITVNATDFMGWNNEMKIVNGRPAITWWGTAADVYYAHSTTPDGLDPLDWVTVNVSVDAAASAIYPSLAVVATKPVVAFLDETNKYLLYKQSSTVDGDLTIDWGPADLTVDNSVTVGLNGGCSCVGVQGRIAIAFNDDGNDHLVYAILL